MKFIERKAESKMKSGFKKFGELFKTPQPLEKLCLKIKKNILPHLSISATLDFCHSRNEIALSSHRKQLEQRCRVAVKVCVIFPLFPSVSPEKALQVLSNGCWLELLDF